MNSSRWLDRGLLLARVALGLVFVVHGGQKLFVIGHDGVAGFLTQLGVPFPAVNAVLVTAAEFGGGIAMLLGLFTRVAGVILAFNMTIAILTVHLSKGFFNPAGVEFPLTLLLVSLAVALTGAGRYSVDARLHTPLSESTLAHKHAA